MGQLEHLKELYKKYIDDQLSDPERVELYTFFEHAGDEVLGELIDSYLNQTHSIPNLDHLDHRTDRVFSRIRAQILPARKRLRWLPYAAAAIVGVLGIAWFLLTDTPQTMPDSRTATTDILPGGNRAMLTLADGKTIALSEAEAGIIIHDDQVTYTDRSKQIARLSPDAVGYMVLATPNGGTYQVTLPDGTEVWLNAASELTYPLRFFGTERVVTISGEAYFSVAKNAQNPFKVISKQQEIQVLGTAFNVSAYADEPETKTTLVQGGVQIRNVQSGAINRLLPNEQSVVHASSTEIQQVDAEPYIAWKNGYFYFKHTPFEEVMRQLARWYDVEVIYRGEVPQEAFSGKMGRELTLNAALKLLNVSAVQVEITDGNKLIVH
ncbi:FecR domain-containing protein [Parapedobacter sp. GCM10030251]|uniref:FecR domain-containing protein n=1 Tax=Parapedobacter sp. GCM10030251 TaxID=3273419 RepID=UPI00361442EB